MATWAPDRDILVRSSLDLVNEALAAGHTARPLVTRYAVMCAELDRRLARPLPPEGTLEHRWATGNRARYTAETVEARSASAAAVERWARLMDQLIDAAPERCSDVEYAVWGDDTPATVEA
jgi:hypothetical protein